jgi:hypothetical protein
VVGILSSTPTSKSLFSREKEHVRAGDEKQIIVPPGGRDALYRIIASDERNTAVLKQSSTGKN